MRIATFPSFFFQTKHIIIISPHCDDVAFAMGGTLHKLCRQNIHIDILNCFSYSGYSIDASFGEPEIVTKIRKAEDYKIVSFYDDYKLMVHYLDIEDALLRAGRNQQNLYNETILPNEKAIISMIIKGVNNLLTPGTMFLAPLAIGKHIDHLLCRMASENFHISRQQFFIYYEDQPYQSYLSKQDLTVDRPSMSPFFCKIDLFSKSKLLDCYPSQLYPQEHKMILNYALELGQDHKRAIERFWIPMQQLFKTRKSYKV